MKLISCQNGRILTSLKSEEAIGLRENVVATGFTALDEIAPDGGFACGAIHELLWTSGAPFFFALTLVQATIDRSHGRQSVDAFPPRTGVRGYDFDPPEGAIIWCDFEHDLYPPAITSLGLSLDHLYLLRPEKREDRIWAITECLRCKGVAATIASVDHLSRLEARRLQLAAERGGGMGLLLRPMIRACAGFQAPPVYAATTRWLVSPEVGGAGVQRWKVQLIHGHGGRVGETVILEHSRETNLVRTVKKLADRPMETRLRPVG